MRSGPIDKIEWKQIKSDRAMEFTNEIGQYQLTMEIQITKVDKINLVIEQIIQKNYFFQTMVIKRIIKREPYQNARKQPNSEPN